MNRLSKLVLAGAILTVTVSVANASPPPYTPSYHPTVKIYPPKPYPPPVVVVKTPPVVVFPTITRSYVAATPIVPVRHLYTVYYRFSPFGPWVRFTSTHNWWRAEELREELLFYYGVDAVVF